MSKYLNIELFVEVSVIGLLKVSDGHFIVDYDKKDSINRTYNNQAC